MTVADLYDVIPRPGHYGDAAARILARWEVVHRRTGEKWRVAAMQNPGTGSVLVCSCFGLPSCDHRQAIEARGRTEPESAA